MTASKIARPTLVARTLALVESAPPRDQRDDALLNVTYLLLRRRADLLGVMSLFVTGAGDAAA